jgi:hypothetical protein
MYSDKRRYDKNGYVIVEDNEHPIVNPHSQVVVGII